jgi:uncharacterized protein
MMDQGYGSLAWRAVRAVLIACLVVLVALMFLENRLLFYPFKYPAGDWKPGGLVFEDAWFQASDGVKLHGWYVPKKDAKAAILFCHGNAGNITHRAEALMSLNRTVGASVLIFDYRGYGRSQGSPNEKGILDDARAARQWLADREKIHESDIVMMGESIGGAVAVDLAAKDGARALVLESTFDSIREVAAYHFPWLPVRWLMRTKLNSVDKIGDYRGPLLQAHGDADTVVPLRCGERLFKAANEPKQWILLERHDHNDSMPSDYYKELSKFLDGLKPTNAKQLAP